MTSDQDIFSNARIIDLRDSTVIDLNVESKVSIGLTVDDQVISSTEDDDPQAVIVLCHIERRRDGHWLIPDPYLPCLLNDDDVAEPTLLSQGSTVKCGDRFLRYTYFQTKKRRTLPRTPGTPFQTSPSLRNPPVSPRSAPPPKPKRSYVYTGSLDDLTLIGNEENTDETNDEINTFKETCQSEIGLLDLTSSVDEELIKHVKAPIEIANMAASYVCRQVMMYTDSVLSSSQLDNLFKALQHAANYAEKVISAFITEYTDIQKEEEGNFSSGSTHALLPTEAKPIHGPVIHLLIELLKLSLDPREHVELWLQLLCTFSHFNQNLSEFICYQGAPVIMGVMAAFGRSVEIQQNACSILSQLAIYQPILGEKGPVRESCVELTVRAMKLHPEEPRVLRPACRTLANITTTYSSLVEQILSPEMEGQTELVNVSDLVVSWLNLLDFIQSESLSTVLDSMESQPHDLGIQTEGRRILLFFFEADFETSDKEELLDSARHSIAESSAKSIEYQSSFESSWYKNSMVQQSDDLEEDPAEHDASVAESGESLRDGAESKQSEGQPDLICEMGVSNSPKPDLVSGQEIIDSCTGDHVPESTSSAADGECTEVTPRKGKSTKKRRITHKDIKNKVKAMINKGRLKLSESTGKKKKANPLVTQGVPGKFKKNAESECETETMSEMKKNLSALLNEEQSALLEKSFEEERISVEEQSQETGDSKDDSERRSTSTEKDECNNVGTKEVPKIVIDSEWIPPDDKVENTEETRKEPTTNDVAHDDIDTLLDPEANENVKELQRRYSTRKRWTKAERPDVQNLLSKEPLSLADSLEGAVYVSSYSCTDYIEGEDELEPEIVEEIRINKTKWKQVVAQIKNQSAGNVEIRRKSSVEDNAVAGAKRTISPADPVQLTEALEAQFDNNKRVIVSPKPKTETKSENDENSSPDKSDGSDDYFVIATPEKGDNRGDAAANQFGIKGDEETDDVQESDGIDSENKTKPAKAAKKGLFGFSPLIGKAKEKVETSSKKSPKSEKADTLSKTKQAAKGETTFKSKTSSLQEKDSKKDVRTQQRKSPGRKKDQKKAKENSTHLVSESAVSADNKSEELETGDVNSEPQTVKQGKRKSPNGSRTADRISEDHKSVMQILASRTLILNHVMTTWKVDRPRALELLQVPTHQILRDAQAPQDLVSVLEQQNIDKLVLRDADPALAMNLLQVLCDSPFGQQIALKLAESTSELLTDKQRPYHVHLAATCLHNLLQGPLAKPDPQGNDTPALKNIHKKINTLLKLKDMEEETFASLSTLNKTLEDRLLCKHKNATLAKDYV